MKCFTGEQNSVKAANGTLTDDDRSYIRQEISKLKKEIDSISEKTTFNEIQVLKGKDVPVSEEDEDVVVTGEMPALVKWDRRESCQKAIQRQKHTTRMERQVVPPLTMRRQRLIFQVLQAVLTR